MTVGTAWMVVTGTRADFGLWRPVLEAARSRGIEPALLVTAMHLDHRFGRTVDEVRAANFPIVGEVPATPIGDSRMEMAAAIGHAVAGMAPVIDAHRPDWLLLLGDRGEQLAAALVGVHVGVPIAHLHGGERSLGAVDDVVRDMITRTAALHLVAHLDARERLQTLGIETDTIRVVGAPGLDAIRNRRIGREEEVRRRYGVANQPYILLVQHPETIGTGDPLEQIRATLSAIRRERVRTIAVFPNADAGGRGIAALLEEAVDDLVTAHRSIPHDDFIALLAGADALVGNSSSGIIEAPFLGVPTVNIGDRQKGRLRGDNVLDVPPIEQAVSEALVRARTTSFRAALSGISPYGDGHAAERIVAHLMAA